MSMYLLHGVKLSSGNSLIERWLTGRGFSCSEIRSPATGAIAAVIARNLVYPSPQETEDILHRMVRIAHSQNLQTMTMPENGILVEFLAWEAARRTDEGTWLESESEVLSDLLTGLHMSWAAMELLGVVVDEEVREEGNHAARP
jgi:hypothetical protein